MRPPVSRFPLSNRACGFLAHGLTMILTGVACAGYFSPCGPLSAAPVLPAPRSPDREVVHFVELPVGIPRPKVIPPATKHGCRCCNDLLHVFPALPPARQLPHAVPEFLCRLRARPPLHKMLVRRPLYAPLLSTRAAQKHKALLSPSQVHQLRL